MAKRQVYTGMYTRAHHRSVAGQHTHYDSPRDLQCLANLVSRYIWAGYNMMNGNYLALATVFAVVLLSFLIPDISQKIHATSELKNMKKVLNLVTKEVGRAEVACLTAADEICHLHCTMTDDATETVSVSQETFTTCQSAPATTCGLQCQSQCSTRRKSASLNEFSSPTETHPTRKSQSCPTYTQIHSMLRKR